MLSVRQIHIRVIGAVIAVAALAGIGYLAEQSAKYQDRATQELSATRR